MGPGQVLRGGRGAGKQADKQMDEHTNRQGGKRAGRFWVVGCLKTARCPGQADEVSIPLRQLPCRRALEQSQL